MDALTILDTYNSGTTTETQPKPVTRSDKDDAFYGAATNASIANKDLSSSYYEILDGMARFGNSPILDELKNTYKASKQEELAGNVEQIMMNTALSAKERIEAIRQAEADIQAATAKKMYIEVVQNKTTTSNPQEREVLEQSKNYPRKIPGKIIRPNSEESRRIAAEQESFLEKLENFGVRIIGNNPVIYEGMGTGIAKIATGLKGLKEQYKKEGFWATAKGMGEAGLTVLSGLGLMAGGGYAAMWKVAAEDTDAADAILKDIMSAAYAGDGEAYMAAMEAMDGVGTIVDIPFRMLGDYGFEKTLELTGNADLSAGVGTTLYVAPAAALMAPAQYALHKGLKETKKEHAELLKLHERVEPVMGISPDSPIGETAKVNRPAAANYAAGAIRAGDETMADAMGTTRADLIAETVLPKINEELTQIYPDTAQRLRELDATFLEHMEKGKVDPYLFDQAAIRHDMDLHMELAWQQHNLYPQVSSSYIENTGSAMRGHMIYGKAENLGFTDEYELFDKMTQLRHKIAKQLDQKPRDVNLSIVEDPTTGTKFIKWDFFNIYDPVKNTALGLAGIQANFGKWDVSEFANTPAGKIFFSPAMRLPEWLVAGPAAATARSTNLTKNWSEAITKDILSIYNQNELKRAILETEERGAYLTPKDITEMFPTLSAPQLKEVNHAYAVFRRLDDQLYAITNEMYRDKKINAGFEGLYELDGTYLNKLGYKVPTDSNGLHNLEGMDKGQAKKVFDFTRVSQLTPDGERQLVHRGEIDVNTAEKLPFDVYKLEAPIAMNGHTYEFVTGLQGGRVPERLLPHVPGHYPHVNDEPYFIKAIPKNLVINGNTIIRSNETEHLFNEAATTVGVERSLRAAEGWAKELQKSNPDFEYAAVSDRRTIQDNLGIHFESVKYAKDWAKARKKERLMTSDGDLARLKDPVQAVHDALNQAAKYYSHKEFDAIFRKNWLDSYGVFSRGEWPTDLTAIRMEGVPDTTANHTLFKAARSTYEQYAKQAHAKETILDPLWQAGTLKLARMFEESSPAISDIARNLNLKREPVLSTALKLAYMRAISLNPLKQYIVQPAQLNEFAAMAAVKGNYKALGDVSFYGPQIFSALVAKNSAFKKVIPFGDVMISKDPVFQKILKSFEDSGIPSTINMHAVVDGVFVDSRAPLAKSGIEVLGRKTAGTIKAVGHTPRAAGFDKAELINQIGLWLMARADFQFKNPHLKWDDPHNLEQIKVNAMAMGNFMLTRADLLPYQEGTFRAFMQFAAFGNKAVIQPFTSKYLTNQEKVNLAAIRALMYGKRGILGGEIIDKVITHVQDQVASGAPEDVQKKTTFDTMMDLYRRGMFDLAVNSSLRAWFDDPDPKAPKTYLALSANMSPSPESTLPVLDFIWKVMDIYNQEQPASKEFPFLSGISAMHDTINTLWDALYVRKNEPETEDEAKRYINQLASWAVGWSNFEKGLAMRHAEQLVDKFHNNLGIGTTVTESFAKQLGISSMKETLYYQISTDRAKLAKEIKSSAERIVTDLDFIMSTYGVERDFDAFTFQMYKRVNSLIGLYAQQGMEEEIRAEIYAIMKKQASKGLRTSIQSLLDQNASTYQGYRRSIAEKMNLLEETAGHDSAIMLRKIYGELKETANAPE